MDGTRYTYVKTDPDTLFSFTFDLLRPVALEFLAFAQAYSGDQWQMTDHKNRVVVGYLVTNPFTLTMNGKANDTEKVSLAFDFQGAIQ